MLTEQMLRHKGLRADAVDRPAFSGADAATELRRLTTQGALDRRTTDAVLAAAGHGEPLTPKSRGPQHPGGLTGREAEVLRLAARGMTTRVPGPKETRDQPEIRAPYGVQVHVPLPESRG
jgi:hypothetical protein